MIATPISTEYRISACNTGNLVMQRIQEIWGNPSWDKAVNLIVLNWPSCDQSV